MTSEYLTLKPRTESEARYDIAAANLDIRAHQIRRLVELEQEAEYWERLSLTLTDREARAEALRLSVETAARAIRVRNAVALTNFMVPPSADDRENEETTSGYMGVSWR